MGEQSATRLKGDDFQHLYSWYELLQLLDPDSGYAYGYVEHPKAGAADDVTIHPANAQVPAKFVQIKYHVDHRSDYSPEALIAIDTNSARSLFHKLYDSWKELGQENARPVEIWLVSNWSSSKELGRFIRDSCALDDDFFKTGSRSLGGQVRKQWRTGLGIEDQEVHDFCRSLRLRLGFGGLHELEERVDDRMARYGLRTGRDPQALVLNIVRGWIKDGGRSKRIDKNVLEEVIRERGLRSTGPKSPKVSLWIHGWAKRYYDFPPTVDLNWTKYFDIETRRIPTQSTWEKVLLPDLKKARAEFSNLPNAMYIDLRGKMPLSASLVVGRLFAEAMGFSFRVEQPSGGEIHLWRSDVGASGLEIKSEVFEGNPKSKIGIVSLSVTGDARPDIRRQFVDGSGTRFRIWIDLEPLLTGPSSTSLQSDRDAVSIAVKAKEQIRELRARYGLREIWLIPYCPASLALFLGQRLNALGTVVLFERDARNSYQEAVRLES